MDNIIRCNDCEHYIKDYKDYYGNEFGRCNHPKMEFDVECYDMWLEMEPDDYCSYGVCINKSNIPNNKQDNVNNIETASKFLAMIFGILEDKRKELTEKAKQDFKNGTSEVDDG